MRLELKKKHDKALEFEFRENLNYFVSPEITIKTFKEQPKDNERFKIQFSNETQSVELSEFLQCIFKRYFVLQADTGLGKSTFTK